jgi:hypothetical protein
MDNRLHKTFRALMLHISYNRPCIGTRFLTKMYEQLQLRIEKLLKRVCTKSVKILCQK